MGLGLEYGHFRWGSDNAWEVKWAMYDNTGSCGIWDPTTTPFTGFVGTIAETATTLTLTPSGSAGLVFNRLASPVGSIVGAWSRNDGHDGSAVIFEANGTYIYVDPQDGQNTGDRPGVERGCYTVNGSTFTIDLSATCRPDGDAGFDTNGTSGFSSRVGTPIPFTISAADVLTIGGFAPMKRMAP